MQKENRSSINDSIPDNYNPFKCERNYHYFLESTKCNL